MSMKPLNQVRMGRRCFLKRSAVAAAATCVAPLLDATGQIQISRAAHAVSGDCQALKIPLKSMAEKVAFITGGSSGIGLGIARAFADAGMKVIITYRTREHLNDAMKYLSSAGSRVHAISVDVTDRPGMEKAAEESTKVFGRVHVLVNNAGVQNPAPLGATAYDEWDRLMAVNLGGVFNGTRAFLPRIKEHGEGGQIVTTSSVLGLFTVGAGYAAYCASKFAVVAMMEALRAELAETNIGVSLVCPGVVKSNLEEGLKNSPIASDPLEIGQLVLRGIRNNDLYILTHPEFEPLIRQRSEALAGSIFKDLHPTEARVAVARSIVDNSVYSAEMKRYRCTRG